MITCQGDTITAMTLPSETGGHAVKAAQNEPAWHHAPYKEYLGAVRRDAEEQYLIRMLQAHKGNIIQIARLMEIDRKTVYRKMAEYGIEPEQFRD
jgi:DNA-binding NtrC family response regulator